MTVATLPKPIIKLDGDLSDWVASERIDYGDMAGYSLYAQVQGDYFDFAFGAPLQIGAGTTFWFNTDLNAATGFEVFGWAAGAEYSVTINSDSTATLYTSTRRARSSRRAASRSPTRPTIRRSSSL